MRLAALTATNEDVDELSKTFKMARPSAEAIKQAAPAAKTAPAVQRAQVQHAPARPPAKHGSGNLLLMIIVALVLMGIVAIVVF